MTEQTLNVIFKNLNGMEVCEIRAPGDRDAVKVFPAHSFHRAHMVGGDSREQTYAERWNDQYRQFKEGLMQMQNGTDLRAAPFITETKARELRALGFHSLEQLAAADGRPLKVIGPGGRDLKDKAAEFLAAQETSEIDVLRKRIADLETERVATPVVVENAPEGDDESSEKANLKAKIAELTGAKPRGNPSVETLREMLADATPKEG